MPTLIVSSARAGAVAAKPNAKVSSSGYQAAEKLLAKFEYPEIEHGD